MLVNSQQAARLLPVLIIAGSVTLAAGTACRRAAPPMAPPTRTDSSDENDRDSDAARPGETSVVPEIAQGDGRSDGKLETAPNATEFGQQLYARHCEACHGTQGDGQGIAAAYLFPKPRNIQAGRFRLISTSNNVPSRDDLHAVLLRGIPGSSMPPWAHLSQVERDALVDEVMRLRLLGARARYVTILREEDELTDEEISAEDVQQETQEYVDGFTTPGESTPVPDFGPPTEEGLARAKEAYATFGCLQCHGNEGKGDGVQKMVDDEGYPTAPRDFTAGIFKGGSDPASLYRRIAYGMPGTPMPSSNQMAPDQVVELVHYVRSLSTEAQRQAAVLNREQIIVKALATLPEAASDETWSDVPSVSLRMAPLWWRNDADPDLRVQAVHDVKAMVVRISWSDSQQDRHAASSESFEDAVAMQLYRGDAEPFLGMGGPRSAVDVWFWDADRQGIPLAVEELYPNAVVDIYPFSETVVTTAELDRDGARTADQPDISLPARAAGNQIIPSGSESGASSLAGGGPGSSTFRPPTSQHVHGVGQWRDGRWIVLMTRPLALDSEGDGVSLKPGDKASVAFAVWDGAAQDRDGKKLITIWQDLVLE
jgi:DMSO reductase family type II enzyme heme b subunit